MRRHLLGLGFVAASSLLALHAAHALTAPQPITIDGGPLGDLEISGGVDGYGYVMSNTPNGIQSNGFDISSGILNIQKTTGIVQFTIELGANSFQVLGAEAYDGKGHIAQASVTQFPTGPLYEGYITIAPPNSPITVSAGMLPSVEGWEYGADYYNAVQLETLLYYVQNNNARGVEATLTEGPFSATVQFGDSTDSGVWNTLQALLSYKFNANNVLNVYGAYNLGKTGPNTYMYALPSSTKTGWGNAYANNALIGAYYNYTLGNLSLVPEIQYTYARPDRQIGITGESSTFGAALFGDYTFGTSPYSLGGWVEYFDSHAAANASTVPGQTPTTYTWAISPNAEAIGLAVAPTWQYKNLFARANAGYIYLLHTKGSDGVSYQPYSGSHGQFTGTLEAGLLF
ncbi:MAG: hypothetical protein P4L52_05810 [Acidocella sp.]|nr:hypothetical protein [Acidocella sp.]